MVAVELSSSLEHRHQAQQHATSSSLSLRDEAVSRGTPPRPPRRPRAPLRLQLAPPAIFVILFGALLAAVATDQPVVVAWLTANALIASVAGACAQLDRRREWRRACAGAAAALLAGNGLLGLFAVHIQAPTAATEFRFVGDSLTFPPERLHYHLWDPKMELMNAFVGEVDDFINGWVQYGDPKDARVVHRAEVEGITRWNAAAVQFRWLLHFWETSLATSAAYTSSEVALSLPPFVCLAEADVSFNATRVGELLMGEGWDAGRDGAYGSDRGGGGVGGSSLAGWGGGIRAPFLLAHVQHLCGDDWREFERANFGLVCAGRGPPPKWAVGLLRVMAGLSATRYRRFVPLTALVSLFGRHRRVLEWERDGGCTHLTLRNSTSSGNGGATTPCTYVHFSQPKEVSVIEAVQAVRAERLRRHGEGVRPGSADYLHLFFPPPPGWTMPPQEAGWRWIQQGGGGGVVEAGAAGAAEQQQGAAAGAAD